MHCVALPESGSWAIGELTLSCAVLSKPLLSLPSAAKSPQLVEEVVSVAPMLGHGLLVDNR